jgi:pimeloyl-ACP methyl ester carboxylesterase
MLKKTVFSAALLCGVAGVSAAFAASSDPVKLERKLLKNSNLTTEVFAQGKGPIIVILPSLGRSVRDYDEVSMKLAQAGFRVIRPEPRGIGASTGPMKNQNMHAFANGIAYVIEAMNIRACWAS